MTILYRLAIALLLMPFGLVGCSATGDRASDTATAPDYSFVFILTGPTTDLSEDEQTRAFQGHFSNMSRMANEGDLLIAGPFGDPKSDPNHRGLWVFDTPDPAVALEHGRTDPAVQMGVFVLEANRLTTDAPLRNLVAMNKAEEARRAANPDDQTPPVRAYTLATRSWSEQHLAEAAAAPGVIFAGRLHGSGDDGSDEVIAWLDAETAEAGAAMLPDAGRWTMHGWWGSSVVADLPR